MKAILYLLSGTIPPQASRASPAPYWWPRALKLWLLWSSEGLKKRLGPSSPKPICPVPSPPLDPGDRKTAMSRGNILCLPQVSPHQFQQGDAASEWATMPSSHSPGLSHREKPGKTPRLSSSSLASYLLQILQVRRSVRKHQNGLHWPPEATGTPSFTTCRAPHRCLPATAPPTRPLSENISPSSPCPLLGCIISLLVLTEGEIEVPRGSFFFLWISCLLPHLHCQEESNTEFILFEYLFSK